MPRGAKDFIQHAKKKGGDTLPPSVNGERIHKSLELQTERRHQRKLEQWNQFVNEVSPAASAYDLKSLKHFIRLQAQSIDGTRNKNPCVETVRHYWNMFTGAWKRKHLAIPRDVIESVTNYIYGDLMKELDLLREKKPRRYANRNHLKAYAVQLWQRDWYEYDRPGTRVTDWGLLLSNIFTSSRIGEYIESSARTGTGRGLKYKDVMFMCFLNEDSMPELAIRLTKDAKNMSKAPDSKRPKNSLAEGREPDLLCFNSLLPYLANLLNISAFRDYNTIEELLDIRPPEHTISHPILWREDLLDTPFFLSPSKEGCIETAGAFAKRNHNLGVRAGFPEPPTMHDWRANSLFLIDKHYSECDRMGAAAHDNRDTYHNNYQSHESRVDGQNTFLGNKRREAVSEAFLELSIPYQPNLCQQLPAEQKYKLEMSQANRSKESNSIQSLKQHRQNWRNQVEESLKECQKAQCHQPTGPLMYHYGVFDRCRFLMPERDRLAKNLFKKATLRSTLGISVLHDMMSLLRMSSEVEFRPGLERDKCQCQDTKKMLTYDWKHVYDCYKKRCIQDYGFGELCFTCNDWLLSEKDWDSHCLGHTEDTDWFPSQFDPLVHGGVLATPGYCPFCLANHDLPSSTRVYQYLNRAKWLLHVRKHISVLERRKSGDESITIRCPLPEPQCPKSFEEVLHLQFHLNDVHGIPVAKPPNILKRLVTESGQAKAPKPKRFRSASEPSSPGIFINITAASLVMQAKDDSKGSLPIDNAIFESEPLSSAARLDVVIDLGHASTHSAEVELLEFTEPPKASPTLSKVAERPSDFQGFTHAKSFRDADQTAPKSSTAATVRPAWDYVFIAGDQLAQGQENAPIAWREQWEALSYAGALAALDSRNILPNGSRRLRRQKPRSTRIR